MTGWQEGRQGTGYRKKLLSHGKRWDLYLLDYPKSKTRAREPRAR